MITKVNKYVIRIVAMVSILVLICICVYGFIHIWFAKTSKWKYNVENFAKFQEDFQVVADFCIETVEENTEIIYFSLNKNNIVYAGTKSGGQEIYASKDILNSFCNIEFAFPDSDAKLDVIYCVNGSVYFTTHNGLYSVVYSPNTKPTTMSGGGTVADIKQITKDWYHAVKK